MWENAFAFCFSNTSRYLKVFTTKEMLGYSGLHSDLQLKSENPKELLENPKELSSYVEIKCYVFGLQDTAASCKPDT